MNWRGHESAELTLSFAPGARLDSASEPVLHHGGSRYELGEPRQVWERLEKGASLDSLRGCVCDLAPFLGQLGYLQGQGAIAETLRVQGRKVAARVRGPGFELTDVAPEGPLVLSKYAFLRREGEGLLLESPLARARIEILDPAAMPCLFAATRPRDSAFVQFLGESGFMVSGAGPEHAEQRHWEFHDLLFHWRSRPGAHSYPWGTRDGESLSPPADRLPFAGDVLPLPAVCLEEIESSDITLTRALETRRSLREAGDGPLHLAEISEFLYRVARKTQSGRVYPSGGARYELEVYLNAGGCEGLQDGFYRYDPNLHRLEILPTGSGPRLRCRELAARACGSCVGPRALFVLAARFQRLSTRYRTISYALILKHVGVLLQTMSLVATAMRLPACAVGSGNVEQFRRLTGRDPIEESSVGEFVLW